MLLRRGAAIVLRRGEYRELMGIDFLVSDIAADRELRKQLQEPQALEQLFGIGRGPLIKMPEVRADQYGIRARLPLANDGIKFEIVFEARIIFDAPGPDDVVVLDGFSTGHAWEEKDCEILRVNLLDQDKLTQLLKDRYFDGVIHFTAKSLVGKSVKKPDLYYGNNVVGTLNLVNERNYYGFSRI